jgi:HK97 family phage major capsid protein
MSQGVPSEGGFLVAPEFSTQIWEGMSGAPDAILSLTDNYTVTGESLTFNADAETSRATGSRRGGIQAYWMSEAAQYTASKPKFRQVRIEPQDLGVFVYLTDKLMNNSAVALQQYVSRCAADEINTMVTEAIINGNGVGQPKGIMSGTYSDGVSPRVRVTKETSQAAATLNQENISKMWARMHPKLRAGAVWLINCDVEPALDTLSTTVKNVAATENVGGYANKVFDPQNRTIKGRPIITCESCQTLGTEGDIILWAPQAYLTGTRGGVKEAMSMHLRFDYNESAFRFLFSVDGQPWHNAPITPLKGTNYLSSIVTCQTR